MTPDEQYLVDAATAKLLGERYSARVADDYWSIFDARAGFFLRGVGGSPVAFDDEDAAWRVARIYNEFEGGSRDA